jgi:hypothetical protein
VYPPYGAPAGKSEVELPARLIGTAPDGLIVEDKPENMPPMKEPIEVGDDEVTLDDIPAEFELLE